MGFGTIESMVGVLLERPAYPQYRLGCGGYRLQCIAASVSHGGLRLVCVRDHGQRLSRFDRKLPRCRDTGYRELEAHPTWCISNRVEATASGFVLREFACWRHIAACDDNSAYVRSDVFWPPAHYTSTECPVRVPECAGRNQLLFGKLTPTWRTKQNCQR